MIHSRSNIIHSYSELRIDALFLTSIEVDKFHLLSPFICTLQFVRNDYVPISMKTDNQHFNEYSYYSESYSLVSVYDVCCSMVIDFVKEKKSLKNKRTQWITKLIFQPNWLEYSTTSTNLRSCSLIHTIVCRI